MRIGIFTELYLPSVGGQEIRFEELANTLTKKGHEVFIYCIAHAKNLPPEEIRDGVNIRRMPVDPQYKTPRIQAFRRNPITMLRYGWWTRSVARQEKFDLNIFNQWPFTHVLFAPRDARDRGIIDWCEIRNGNIFKLLQRKLPNWTRYNMAVSQAVANNISSVSANNVLFLASGINLDQYKVRSRTERSGLLYLGRIAEHKNLGFLIEGFEKAATEGYDGRLTIAGAGPGLAAVASRASSSHFGRRIDVLGSVTNEAKADLLSSHELLMMPSRREGFPRVIAEAMASGTPVVTVNYSENGARDVVRQYGCGVVSEPTASAFAAGVRSALQGWSSFSTSGLEWSTTLDWGRLVDKLEEWVA